MANGKYGKSHIMKIRQITNPLHHYITTILYNYITTPYNHTTITPYHYPHIPHTLFFPLFLHPPPSTKNFHPLILWTLFTSIISNILPIDKRNKVNTYITPCFFITTPIKRLQRFIIVFYPPNRKVTSNTFLSKII